MGKLFSVFLAATWVGSAFSQSDSQSVAAYQRLAETSCVSLATLRARPRSSNTLNQKLLKAKADWEKKTAKVKDIAAKEKLFADYRTTVMAILKVDAPSVYSLCEGLTHIEEDCKKAHANNAPEIERCISNEPKQRIEKIEEALTSALK